MNLLTFHEIQKFRNWIKKWNDGYPMEDIIAEIGMFELDPHWVSFWKIRDSIIKEINVNIDLIESDSQLDEYVEEVRRRLDEIQFWVDTKAISKDDFLKDFTYKYANGDVIGKGKVDVNMTHEDHYDSFIQYPKELRDKVENHFNGIAPINLTVDEMASIKKPFTHPSIKSAHLHIFLQGLSKHLNDQKKYPKTLLADLIARVIFQDEKTPFSAKKIRQGATEGPSAEEMIETSQVLYDIANIIDEEIKNNKSGKYFSSK